MERSRRPDRSGGLISIWNRKVFSKTSLWHSRELLVSNERWSKDDEKMVIINVYAPCSATEKEGIWDTIKIVIEQARICVVGDFNSIKEANERVRQRGEVDSRDIRLFAYHFIEWTGGITVVGLKIYLVQTGWNL
ncbi:hypothetical protein ACS0TY_007460 [Phlomoides rotata]